MGQVIAKRLRDEGAAVVVAGRKMGELERFAAEIDGHALPCDITHADQVEALAEHAKALLGGIDIAVNATGWGLLRPFLDTSVDDLEAMTALQF
jgi:NADP-dependent 3-hydroxy acid dehydrogenase YdfG